MTVPPPLSPPLSPPYPVASEYDSDRFLGSLGCVMLFEKALGTVGKILRTLSTRVISIGSTLSDSYFSSSFFCFCDS